MESMHQNLNKLFKQHDTAFLPLKWMLLWYCCTIWHNCRIHHLGILKFAWWNITARKRMDIGCPICQQCLVPVHTSLLKSLQKAQFCPNSFVCVTVQLNRFCWVSDRRRENTFLDIQLELHCVGSLIT